MLRHRVNYPLVPPYAGIIQFRFSGLPLKQNSQAVYDLPVSTYYIKDLELSNAYFKVALF
jgi:hypothetical protein